MKAQEGRVVQRMALLRSSVSPLPRHLIAFRTAYAGELAPVAARLSSLMAETTTVIAYTPARALLVVADENGLGGMEALIDAWEAGDEDAGR